MNVIGKLDNTVIDAMGIMQKQDNDISIDMGAVSYTHLTLPTT